MLDLGDERLPSKSNTRIRRAYILHCRVLGLRCQSFFVLEFGRDRVAAEKKKALEQGLPWPPPSKAAIAEAKKQLQQDGWEPPITKE
jgi:hypothetical protein